MATPVMHIAAGMSFPFFLGLPWLLRLTSKKLLVVVLLMILCGSAAVLPDAPRYFMRKEVADYLRYGKGKPVSRYSFELNAFANAAAHDSPYINAFAFHGSLDAYHSEARGFREGILAIFFMFLTVLFAARAAILRNEKEIRRIEKNRTPISSGGQAT